MGHLLEAISDGIKGVISAGGYAGIAGLMAVESACIPLPSEVIMPFSGALTTVAIASGLHRAPLNIGLVALAGAFGCTIGSAIAYAVGASGGREFIYRYGKFVLLRRRDVEKSEAWFQRRGDSTVFLSRLMPVVRTFISLPAGIARMPFGRFLLLSFVGSLPWCWLLAAVGVQFANHLDDLKRYFHDADAVVIAVLILLFAVWLKHHLRPDDEASADAA